MSNVAEKRAATKYREGWEAAMPQLQAEYISLVRASCDPKAYKEALDHGAKVLGIDKEGAAAQLPTFSITFVMPDGTEMATMPQARVVDVQAREVPDSEEIAQADAQSSPQPGAQPGEPAQLTDESARPSAVLDDELRAQIEQLDAEVQALVTLDL